MTPNAPPASNVISLRGVRTHNLQNLDVDIPRGKLVVVTGPSGSGKSSLAFDTLYAEGQRRYVESLSAYTRQFLERMDRPDVDTVGGIPPAIAVERKPPAKTSRSTVGTVTEILDYLRMLYARASVLRCLGCGNVVTRDTTVSNVDRLLNAHAGERASVVFPVIDRSESALDALVRRGFYRVTTDGTGIDDLHEPVVRDAVATVGPDDSPPTFVVSDRLRLAPSNRQRLAEALDAAFSEGGDRAAVFLDGPRPVRLSRGFHCAECDRAYTDPGPLAFSFNSPAGACPRCRGFGDIIDLDPDRIVPDPSRSLARGAVAPWQSAARQKWRRRLMAFASDSGIPTDVPWQDLPETDRRAIFDGTPDFPGVRGFFKALEAKIYKLHVRVFLSRHRRYVTCDACGGTRLRPEALAFEVLGRSIADVCRMSVTDGLAFWKALPLDGRAGETAAPLVTEIVRRLDVMQRAGLDYLTLDRSSRSLSGGEYQRILLAGALGSGLVDTLYVLDEPSVGLHARDNDRLLGILTELRDGGNTVVVVEHDRDIIAAADHVIDLGPGAGEHGGRIVYEGDPAALETDAPGSTAAYLSGRQTLPPMTRRDLTGAPVIGIRGASGHNLDGVDVDVPLGGLVCVTGVSGSGKSTLVEETLYRNYRAERDPGGASPAPLKRLSGHARIDDMLLVDQSPIGRTPRSNPVTYVKAFDGIRKLLSGTRDASRLGLSPGDFSFNVAGGRCETCEGAGSIRIELQFLADLFVTCDDCGGRRYQARILEARYRGKNVHEILQMTVTDAISFFADTPAISRPLWHLAEVGLGYLRLGQPATTLSGGEAQRLKIASHLARTTRGTNLFILDEPTTGLHVGDIGNLLRAFERLLDRGHTVVVVEHNLDVVARADHVIDLGPEGGAGGGRVVATGTSDEIAANASSVTGRHLAAHLKRWGRPAEARPGHAHAPARRAVTRKPGARSARRPGSRR